MVTEKEIKQRLSKAIKSCILPQKYLAEKIDVPLEIFEKYANGNELPPYDKFIYLCVAIDVEYEYILCCDLLSDTSDLSKIYLKASAQKVQRREIFSEDEKLLLENYNSLNPAGKKLIQETLKTLTTSSSSYKKANK